ncbi:MAG TPA: ATP-binding protein [Vicinamibacterales bacterium]|nr:ATP-binding protein [Vicinamibacterales bacterium]
MTRAISSTRTVDEIYHAALDALADGLDVRRAAILLFDADGVMRFKAFRGLSERYRHAVEGHSPWQADATNPEPIAVPDVSVDASLAPYLEAIHAEGIAAMVFVPLVSIDRVIGKFMLYADRPRQWTGADLQLAAIIAAQVAFAVERTRAEERIRRDEERLRFALDAAAMGTWDWDLTTNHVQWSDNLPRMHGLPDGSFDGTFASYEREIHPDDRPRVFASVERALREGVPHEVEYRIVAPDGTVRWCEGKGRVEFENGRPVRMTGVCMMVTRRKEAELARLAAAEEASRAKDEFLATLSHELRTPLNAILGWVQMLTVGGLPPDRARHAIEVIARNARLQSQLIEDILDVSRIITGKLEIERAPMRLPQLIESVITSLAPTATVKQVLLQNQVPADLPPISGDPQRLHQVLGNVLSNALKFTPEGGRVDITAAREPQSVVLQVTDSGIGIDPEFLPHIFDRFRQADSSSTRRHGGLGLGLAIARHLVEQHGGTITASSAGSGSGTTISIRLPVDPAASPAPLRDVEPAGTTPSDALHGLRVLIVDDQRDARELVATLLEGAGAMVQQSPSADDALRAIASGDVDVLVADIAMPGMDGCELMSRVRKDYPSVHGIAMSAYARAEDRSRALSAGYAHYCVKPLDTAGLIAAAASIKELLPQ